MSLTIKGIEAAKPRVDKATGGVKLVHLADGDGLFLEVTATSKLWRARYFFEGKEQMLSLGKYPVVGLKEARDKNFLLRQQLDQGINPALERKKEKERVKRRFSVSSPRSANVQVSPGRRPLIVECAWAAEGGTVGASNLRKRQKYSPLYFAAQSVGKRPA